MGNYRKCDQFEHGDKHSLAQTKYLGSQPRHFFKKLIKVAQALPLGGFNITTKSM